MSLEHWKISVDVVVDVVIIWCSIITFLLDLNILSINGSFGNLLIVLEIIINGAGTAVSSNESC